MKVNVGSRVYEMPKKQYKELLKIASDQILFGIYAIEKNGYAELRKDICESKDELNKKIAEFNKDGFIARYNK